MAHMLFSRVSSSLRYDAYLVVLGLMATATSMSELTPREIAWTQWRDRSRWPRALALSALGLVLLFPMFKRAGSSLAHNADNMVGIYEQQYQMGLFLARYYQGQGVAANDIGAIDYLADVRLTDLAGLATRETGEARRTRSLTAARIGEAAKKGDAAIAIVYDAWFQGGKGLPADWVKVGEWQIPYAGFAASDTAAFYAVTPEAVAPLIKNLQLFSPALPAEVIQRGRYLPGTEASSRK